MNKLNKWLSENKMANIEPTEVVGSYAIITLPDLGDCLYLLSDSRKYVFDEEFNFIVTDEEFSLLDGGEYKTIVFCFGDKFYYSPVNRVRDKYGENAFHPKMNDLKYLGKSVDTPPVPFCHLGVHSEYEIMNGSASADLWAKKAKFLGCDVLGICDKGTLAGTLAFQTSCSKHGIKSILGYTAVVAINYSEDKDNQETFEAKLFAKDITGWENLMSINRLCTTDYKGYIPDDVLLKYAKGLHCVFGKESELYYFIDNRDKVEDIVSRYEEVFESVYFQLDSVEWGSRQMFKKHLQTIDTYLCNYIDLIEPITINDSYYLDKEHVGLKSILNKASGVASAEGINQYFKDVTDTETGYAEWFEQSPLLMEVFNVGWENARALADSCDFKLDSGIKKLPKFEVEDVDALFYEKITEGWEERLGNLTESEQEIYEQQLQKECDVIVSNGLADYFMILWDIMSYCRREGVLTGPGRGSVCGSLAAYLLHITDVDPLKYGLMFERFLNETRVSGERAKSADSLPDIDCDFPTEYRDRVKDYIAQKYGYEYTCSIGTYGRMKLKTCIKDFGKVKQLPFELTNSITKDIDDQVEYTWQDLFKYACKSKKLYDFVQKNPELVHMTKFALLQPKSESVHPSAVIIVPKFHVDGSEREMNMYSWLPVKNVDGHMVSEWEGKYIDKSGFLKEDILGLSQLDKFVNIIRLVKENTGREINLNDIPLDDEETFDYFRRGWNEDVFQFGTNGLTQYCRQVKPTNLDNLIAMTALFRPGPMELRAHEDFADIKNGKKKPKYDIGMEDITGDTFGLYVYQEQIMKAVVVGGLTEVESDVLRTTIKKKDVETLRSFGDKFKEGYQELLKKHGVKDVKSYSEAVWDKLLAFSGYGFNKSHAAAYSLMSYWSQYLKVHHPLEFWTTCLHFSKEGEVPYRLSEMKKTGCEVEVRPPDVNVSGNSFACDYKEGRIFFSLNKIKGVGDVAVNSIVEERDRGGNFFSLEEFISRAPSKVNKTVIKNLIISGAFDLIEEIENPRDRRKLLESFFRSRKEELPEEYNSNDAFTNAFWIMKQKELTGFGDVDFANLIKDAVGNKRILGKYVDDTEFNNAKDGTEVLVAGKLIFTKEKEIKNGRMCRMNIDCNNTIIPVIAWPDFYEDNAQDIYKAEGCIVAILGEVKRDTFAGGSSKTLYTTSGSKFYMVKVE